MCKNVFSRICFGQSEQYLQWYEILNTEFTLIDLNYYDSFQNYVEIPNTIRGLTIEFWAFFTSINSTEFSGYNINYGNVFKLDFLGGYLNPNVQVSYFADKNYSLIDTFPQNQWYYHKASVNFISFISYNKLMSSLDNDEYILQFDSSLKFSSLDSFYNSNHSLYIKKFKLWKVSLPNYLNTSSR